MTTPENASALNLRALAGSQREADFCALAIGAAIAAALGVYSFHPASWGVVFLAAGLLAGGAFPLSGIVAIALAITTLPLVQTGGVAADIRADELLMVVVIGGTALRALAGRSVPHSEVVVPTLVFVGVSAVSIGLRFAVTDFEIRLLAVVFPLAKHMLRLLLFLTVIWLGSRMPKGLGTIRIALIAGGILGALFGIAQSLSPAVEEFLVAYYPSIKGTEVRLFWGQRAFAAFDGNPNHLAASMLLLALLGLSSSDMAQDRRSRVAWFAASLPMLSAIVASASRATYVFTAIMFLVLHFRHKRRVFGWSLVAMAAYTLLVPNLLRTRLAQLIIVVNGGLSAESDVLKKLNAWANPFGQRETLRMTDNFYLDVLVNFWPLALIAFLWLAWVVLRRLRREHAFRSPEPGTVEAALLAWFSIMVLSLNGAFFSIPRVSEILWLVVGLGWAWFSLRDRATPDSAVADFHANEIDLDIETEGSP